MFWWKQQIHQAWESFLNDSTLQILDNVNVLILVVLERVKDSSSWPVYVVIPGNNFEKVLMSEGKETSKKVCYQADYSCEFLQLNPTGELWKLV